MCHISIDIPDAVLYDMNMNWEDATKYAKRAMAVNLYVQDGVSIGYCAEIAGMTETEFMKYLGDRKISIFRYDDLSDLDKEVANAKDYC